MRLFEMKANFLFNKQWKKKPKNVWKLRKSLLNNTFGRGVDNKKEFTVYIH